MSLALALVLIAIPLFVLGFVLQWVFGVKLGWVAPSGITEGWPTSYILPAFVLAAGSLAYVLRLTQTVAARDLQPGLHAHREGQGPARAGRCMRKYGLRNSLIPVVTFLGIDLGHPDGRRGRHRGHLQHPRDRPAAVQRRSAQDETVVVVGIVTILVIVYLLMSLIVDVLYAVLDPRIRYE